MDPLGIDKAIDEGTKVAIPEIIAAANAVMDRVEKMVGRLDGATITLTIHLGK
jgi:hypothetical protein